MPYVTTPTSPTFTNIVTDTTFATSAVPGTTIPLDLRTKKKAVIHVRIGRNVATALTRAAKVLIRRTNDLDSTNNIPNTAYDAVSSIATVSATTVSSGGAAAAQTMVLASGTGFAAGDICCAQLAGARCEFFGITDLATATITNERSAGFKVTHNASDVVTNGADIFSIEIPGGDQWEITPLNNSGQTVVIGVDAVVHASDTTA